MRARLAFALLLLALPASAQEMGRWPDVGGGAQRYMTQTFTSDTDHSLYTTQLCLQSPKQAAQYNSNWNFSYAPPMACISSNNFEVANHFPLGFNVTLKHMQCVLTCDGSCTIGETITLRGRWRNQGNITQATSVGVNSSVLLTVPSGTQVVSATTANIDGTVCPYAATGCSLQAFIVAETLTAGDAISLSCTQFVEMSPAS